MNVIVRPANLADVPALLEIYNYEVENGVATLDLQPKSMSAWELWFDAHQAPNHPLVVAEVDGTVAGYACLSPFRHKDAYRSTVELSVYTHPDWRRRGVASVLMDDILRRAGENPDIHLVISVITGNNLASERLHRKFGFTHVGDIGEVAFKHGKYLSISMFVRPAEPERG